VEKVKLEILGLSPSQSNAGSFALILSEEQGSRRIPIIIGMFEAQAIAIEMEKISPNRPMTHDLFRSFAQAFDYTIEEVIISEIKEGIFYAKISCTDGIRQKFIDARPSDAVAVALRFNVPIYANETVLEDAGINAEEIDKEEDEPFEAPKPKSQRLSDKTLDELNKMLEEALINEEYEKAAKIRDEIDRRN
jgi:uncharacterized protein